MLDVTEHVVRSAANRRGPRLRNTAFDLWPSFGQPGFAQAVYESGYGPSGVSWPGLKGLDRQRGLQLEQLPHRGHRLLGLALLCKPAAKTLQAVEKFGFR